MFVAHFIDQANEHAAVRVTVHLNELLDQRCGRELGRLEVCEVPLCLWRTSGVKPLCVYALHPIRCTQRTAATRARKRASRCLRVHPSHAWKYLVSLWHAR